MTIAATLVSLALAGVLIFIIIDDLRNYQIRNEAVLALLALFFVDVILRGFPRETISHLVFGAVMFGAILGAYALNLMGGGDAKLLAVAMLWLGLENASLFSIFLVGTTLFYLIGAKLRLFPSQNEGGGTWIPFGPAIAWAWLLVLAAPLWRT